MKKTSIKTQICLGFLAVFTIMLLATLFLIFQIRNISQNTKLLYEHPFKVSNTIKNINIKIYESLLRTRDVMYVNNNHQLDSLIIEREILDSIIKREFKIIYANFLGNKNDIDTTYNCYLELKKTEDRIFDYKRENKIDSIFKL